MVSSILKKTQKFPKKKSILDTFCFDFILA